MWQQSINMGDTPADAVRRLIPTGPIDAPLPKGTPFLRRARKPTEGLVFEEDDNRGRRVRTTIHSEGVERIDVGSATGGDVRVVPSFGAVGEGEINEMFEAMKEEPASRPEAPKTESLFEEGMNESIQRRSGRKIFGVPRRRWKGE